MKYSQRLPHEQGGEEESSLASRLRSRKASADAPRGSKGGDRTYPCVNRIPWNDA